MPRTGRPQADAQAAPEPLVPEVDEDPDVDDPDVEADPDVDPADPDPEVPEVEVDAAASEDPLADPDADFADERLSLR